MTFCKSSCVACSLTKRWNLALPSRVNSRCILPFTRSIRAIPAGQDDANASQKGCGKRSSSPSRSPLKMEFSDSNFFCRLVGSRSPCNGITGNSRNTSLDSKLLRSKSRALLTACLPARSLSNRPMNRYFGRPLGRRQLRAMKRKPLSCWRTPSTPPWSPSPAATMARPSPMRLTPVFCRSTRAASSDRSDRLSLPRGPFAAGREARASCRGERRSRVLPPPTLRGAVVG